MKVLVTGAAGFIGFHVSRRLLARGDRVVGIDNVNDYYDPSLKEARLAILEREPGFAIRRHDIADRAGMADIFAGESFDCVVNLAAQAGVRYSLVNPHAYVDANVTGFLNILEGVRHHGGHLVFASSSSVYGSNTRLPFSERDPVDHPVSLYAATKRANELMAHSYAHLFGVRATGLRIFTVLLGGSHPRGPPVALPRGHGPAALSEFSATVHAHPSPVCTLGRHVGSGHRPTAWPASVGQSCLRGGPGSPCHGTGRPARPCQQDLRLLPALARGEGGWRLFRPQGSFGMGQVHAP